MCSQSSSRGSGSGAGRGLAQSGKVGRRKGPGWLRGRCTFSSSLRTDLDSSGGPCVPAGPVQPWSALPAVPLACSGPAGSKKVCKGIWPWCTEYPQASHAGRSHHKSHLCSSSGLATPLGSAPVLGGIPTFVGLWPCHTQARTGVEKVCQHLSSGAWHPAGAG